jgi:hypothetical protein
METQQLTTVDAGYFAQYQGLQDGMEKISIEPGQIQLIQPTVAPALGCAAGVFREKETGQTFDAMQIVILRLVYPRALFPPNSVGDDTVKPICRSDDGIVPISCQGLPTVSEFCRDPATDTYLCPKASWENYNRITKTGKPECGEFWKVVFVEKETKLPYFMTIGCGKTSFYPLKNAISGIKKKQLLAKATLGYEPPMWTFSVDMTSVKVPRTPTQIYYVLNFKNIQSVENPREFGPLFEQFAKFAGTNATKETYSYTDATQQLVEASYGEI